MVTPAYGTRLPIAALRTQQILRVERTCHGRDGTAESDLGHRSGSDSHVRGSDSRSKRLIVGGEKLWPPC